ncbi:FAD-dependent oxidoreductase [Candidatus Woesearchaeota archaeon]|nr:FAD-dependent oxidoreductase [Candidatus Woesearchaeota archaeon]
MYDVIILGQGPAGYTAAIYAARYKLNTMVIGEHSGGLIVDAFIVENYPGFKKISGMELMMKIRKHVEYFDVEIKDEKIVDVSKKADVFVVKTNESEYKTTNIIYALGSEKRRLEVLGEKKFRGHGVSYCSTCDGPFAKNKIAGVVGGSDSALLTTILLSKYAKKIYIIYRGSKLRGDQINIDKVRKDSKVELVYNSNIIEITGEENIDKVRLDTGKELELEMLFVEIGSIPQISMAEKLGCKIDENGYLIVDNYMRTNVEGVFAAGDITNTYTHFKQMTMAVGQGALAAYSAYEKNKRER